MSRPEHAADTATREAFATIADDEARHAQLAWELHSWLCAGLAPEARQRVEAARRARLDVLATGAMTQALALPAELRDTLGLPAPREARASRRTLMRGLLPSPEPCCSRPLEKAKTRAQSDSGWPATETRLMQ